MMAAGGGISWKYLEMRSKILEYNKRMAISKIEDGDRIAKLKSELNHATLPSTFKFYGHPEYILMSKLLKRERKREIKKILEAKGMSLIMENYLTIRFDLFCAEMLNFQQINRSMNPEDKKEDQEVAKVLQKGPKFRFGCFSATKPKKKKEEVV